MRTSITRVLVTGASGFLGGHVVRALARDGITVRATGRDPARLQFDGAVQTVRGDITDRGMLAAAAAGCDAIVHAAALSAPWGARAEFESANVDGTAAVIAAAQAAGVRRLVHISSPAVLFDGQDQVDVTDAASYPAQHSSEYARTKQLAEALVERAAASVETIVLRPKAIYGDGDRALVPRLLRAAARGRLPQIGDGRNRVDVTHVDDVVSAVRAALRTTTGIGERFLITGDEHVVLWDMIRELLAGVGLPAPRRHVSLSMALAAATAMEGLAAITRREPTLTRYSAQILARTQTYDIARARMLLGYAPAVRATEGVARTIDALRRTPGAWRHA